ncbi:MAG: DNA alkylation repair protein [Firmicutes bacterium]|nr:DNA alkylation repair protein [Bacillota bacterium]
MTMDYQAIIAEIEANAEADYARFELALIPGCPLPLLGVRMPYLRRMAQRLAGEWQDFALYPACATYEAAMLQLLVLGYAKAPLADTLPLLKAQLDTFCTWSLVDGFASTYKQLRKEPEQALAFIGECVADERVYVQRLGAVLLLEHFIKEEYIEEVFELLERINNPAYYTQMAKAWAVSIAYVKLPQQTLGYLQRTQMPDATFNKAIQKICESLAVSKEDKAAMRRLKRPGAALKPDYE